MITPSTKTFTTTSNRSYDRHKYELVFIDGRSVVIDDYSAMREAWFQHTSVCSHVNVVDKKKSRGRGF
jgi:hypothetical protein